MTARCNTDEHALLYCAWIDEHTQTMKLISSIRGNSLTRNFVVYTLLSLQKYSAFYDSDLIAFAPDLISWIV